jgi:hypothetical protein
LSIRESVLRVHRQVKNTQGSFLKDRAIHIAAQQHRHLRHQRRQGSNRRQAWDLEPLSLQPYAKLIAQLIRIVKRDAAISGAVLVPTRKRIAGVAK